MIDCIKGKVKGFKDQQVSVILETIGLSFSLSVAQTTSFDVGQEVALYTHMHWNQEQGPSLYGFQTEQEREIFILIIGCSGIGPKMALSMLSQVSIGEFLGAIQTHDGKRLSQLKGIGSKKAEQIILQLKDKIDAFVINQKVECVGVAKHLAQVSDVLKSLNYSRNEIQITLNYLRDQRYDSEPAFDQLMRGALSFLSKKV